MQFNVYSADQPEWTEALHQIPAKNSDINFLPEWYKSWQEYEQATPQCIVAEIDGVIFAYPFFLKPIDSYDLDQTYYDIQTAYGYGGIITNQPGIQDSVVDKFNREVNSWLLDNNVVAEFIREHPLLFQCRRDAGYVRVRQNVYIEPTADYILPDRKARQNISKTLHNNDISVFIDDDLVHLDEFIRLYNLNTSRLNMNKYYYFTDEYFSKIRLLLINNTKLIHILHKDKIINSVIFLHHGNKGTLHLAGSDHEYQALRTNDLMYYSAINLSYNMGLDILNIGGGTSTNEDDSLFNFKKKFSNVHRDVMVGKKIINQPVYNNLVEQWKSKYPELELKYRDFFLKYRQTPE